MASKEIASRHARISRASSPRLAYLPLQVNGIPSLNSLLPIRAISLSQNIFHDSDEKVLTRSERIDYNVYLTPLRSDGAANAILTPLFHEEKIRFKICLL
jgi:hypothetical protein